MVSDSGKEVTMKPQELFQRYQRETRSRRNETSQKDVICKSRCVVSALEELGITDSMQIDGETLALLVDHWEQQGLSEHSVNAYGRIYRAVLNWANKAELVHPSQARNPKLREPQQKRDRALSKFEVTYLLNHVKNHWLETPTALGVYQGLRRREACNVQGSHVDFETGELTVIESKNKEWRVIQMHPQLAEHLNVNAWNESEYVCTNAGGEPLSPDWLTHKFSDYVHSLGSQWEDVTFHSLRHTCATHMAKSGSWTLLQLAKFLGHKTTRTTERYAHLMSNQIQPSW